MKRTHPRPGWMSATEEAEVWNLVKNDSKLQAVKLVKEISKRVSYGEAQEKYPELISGSGFSVVVSMGLKECKDFVDNLPEFIDPVDNVVHCLELLDEITRDLKVAIAEAFPGASESRVEELFNDREALWKRITTAQTGDKFNL